MGSTGNGFQDGWASEPIAIIGMSSKFAGDATNTENLWRMLVEGRSGWTPFPESRFKLSGVYHPNNERLNSVSDKSTDNPNS
jgi:acyl transferase domain-containing protein